MSSVRMWFVCSVRCWMSNRSQIECVRAPLCAVQRFTATAGKEQTLEHKFTSMLRDSLLQTFIDNKPLQKFGESMYSIADFLSFISHNNHPA